MSDIVKLGATFLLLSETVKAFPTFSKPITTIRHIEDGTEEAKDARIGYAMAIAWSLFVAAAIHQSTNTSDVFTLWIIVAGAMALYYEWSLRYNG